MVFNHKIVDKFLNAVFPLPEHFGLDDRYSEPINYEDFKTKVYSVDPEALIDFGISKIVIISSYLENVVIKIPFNGYFDFDDDDNIFWHSFRYANSIDNSDYCLAEWEKYKKLKTYGLNCFVAKTFFYKTIDGIRIFLQEKVTPQSDIFLTLSQIPSKNSKELANQWYNNREFDIQPDWIASCLDKYGKSKVKRFLFYCKNIDPDILEDVHSGNFGYRTNGTPVILDYSNFLDT